MFNRELVKGSTSLILLQLLAEKEMYGYELVKEMEKRSDYSLQVKEGTLYPALHKLEKQEYVESFWKESEKGPARKYYRITDSGQQILEQKTTEWKNFVQTIDKVIGRKGI
ncbi:PadR family transcriptional regulator [Niallia circulans]|jgi:PadR family transcriptional regulator, regulatory protein PadR|uniref:DNA-binding protein n=1 Tax=Niallia circulans TaxID=1397 RepID=A0A0J1IQ09_NIACI|nr:helix-turn-helix transcriptional regulator [Niallia circulans]KLV28046.1 DNA-binding protein [Niallia circulans]MCM2980426.1 helix-turn-helix transcriptional regulator [Niallia circulans]MDR4314870.1 PadR family transcriptional regulator [Niallia circulans]MED3837816.1 helix-turn-helix transcriptional regulator [Niallia circulans]MED4243037.1 helix-turn-helix transcriptional regulator [Niallia circulans]